MIPTKEEVIHTINILAEGQDYFISGEFVRHQVMPDTTFKSVYVHGITTRTDRNAEIARMIGCKSVSTDVGVSSWNPSMKLSNIFHFENWSLYTDLNQHADMGTILQDIPVSSNKIVMNRSGKVFSHERFDTQAYIHPENLSYHSIRRLNHAVSQNVPAHSFAYKLIIDWWFENFLTKPAERDKLMCKLDHELYQLGETVHDYIQKRIISAYPEECVELFHLMKNLTPANELDEYKVSKLIRGYEVEDEDNIRNKYVEYFL